MARAAKVPVILAVLALAFGLGYLLFVGVTQTSEDHVAVQESTGYASVAPSPASSGASRQVAAGGEMIIGIGGAIRANGGSHTVRRKSQSCQPLIVMGSGGLYFGCGDVTAALPPAHGGTHTVNDAAFDAMFFKHYGVNPFIDADEDRFSTFAVDVDTGSYTLARSYLERGALPEKDSVRTEEFLNYFDYGYPPPQDGAFRIHLAAAPSKFGDGKVLLCVGLKGREVDVADRKPAVLTFVIDISGSMEREDRLGLVKRSLRTLLHRLREDDRVGIAVYGSEGEKYMPHTGLDQRQGILDAIDRLAAGGSTNAEEGLAIGYQMADEAFRQGAVNRVVLCSDGVANVGHTGPESILRQIEEHARRGITLSTVGFGMGNYNDVLMEQLADKGDGNYAYVDRFSEARRVFVEKLTGTLQVIAKDVKIQVEFDPAVVRSYRLLGYENRDVADEDFRNDKVDAGEIGAGHAVTALYELKLWPQKSGTLATVRVRYKQPGATKTDEAQEVSREVMVDDISPSFDAAFRATQLAACVAEFAEILRDSYWARDGNLDDVLSLAEQCRKQMQSQTPVAELVELVKTARQLKAEKAKDVEKADGTD